MGSRENPVRFWIFSPDKPQSASRVERIPSIFTNISSTNTIDFFEMTFCQRASFSFIHIMNKVPVICHLETYVPFSKKRSMSLDSVINKSPKHSYFIRPNIFTVVCEGKTNPYYKLLNSFCQREREKSWVSFQ